MFIFLEQSLIILFFKLKNNWFHRNMINGKQFDGVERIVIFVICV